MIKVLIADDEALFRKGLNLILREFDIHVLAEADNGRQALELLKTTCPDLLLLDLEMPELNGSETLNSVKENFPHIKVIMLSSYHDEQVILDLLNRGANAFVSKKEGIHTIVDAIIKVHKNGTFRDNISELLKIKVRKDLHYYKLRFTNKEVEIIQHLCAAHSVKFISANMKVSQKTIETHITEIYKKLNVKNRLEFLRFALKEGFEYLGRRQ